MREDEISADQSKRSDLRLEPALDEAPHASDGPGVRLMLPPVDEGDEARGVQAGLRPAALPGPQPRLLQAEADRRPPAGLGAQQQADEVPRRLADAVEVVSGEAEVQPADVEAGLLRALVQEGGGAAQQHVGHHAHTPQVGGQRHRLAQNQLGRRKLRAAQQGVDVMSAVELHRVTQVCQFDDWLATGIVGNQEVLRLKHTTQMSADSGVYINQQSFMWKTLFTHKINIYLWFQD